MVRNIEKDKLYRATHRVEANTRAKAYYATHKAERNAYDKTWNQTHKEYKAERAKRYYADHLEQEKSRMASYRTDHKELMQQDTVRWRKQHPERVKAWIAKRSRGLGYITLNSSFPGSEGHHVDKEHVIHLPGELHRSIKHNLSTGMNMDMINKVAFSYLNCQGGLT